MATEKDMEEFRELAKSPRSVFDSKGELSSNFDDLDRVQQVIKTRQIYDVKKT